MYGGTSKMFDSSAGGLYTQVFPTPELPLTEGAFSLLAGTFFACDFVKQLWEADRKARRSGGTSLPLALERKGLVYYGIGELARMTYAANSWSLDQDLAKLSKPNTWLHQNQTSPQKALAKAFDIVSKVLIQQYKQKSTNDPNFKHRNWTRDPDTLAAIRSGLGLAIEFGYPPRLWY